MDDFSITKSNQTGEIRFVSGRTSDFTKLKTKYRTYKKQTSQSDFANAPVALQQELDMIMQLKVLAKKEKLPAEYKWLDEAEAELKEKLTTAKINLIANAYYAPIQIKGSAPIQQKTPDDELIQLLNSCKNEEGLLDPMAEAILSSLAGKDSCVYHTKNILEKCREDDGTFNEDKSYAVVLMANAGVDIARMCENIDSFSFYDDESGKEKVDFVGLKDALKMMAAGLENTDAVKTAKYLSGNFEDKSAVKNSILKLKKADVSIDAIFKILNSLTVVNPENGKKVISQSAIDSVFSLKRTLFSTRKNEDDERKNQINLLGVCVFNFGNQTMITKNGEITYISPIEGEDIKLTKERYLELISGIEDEMLVDFASTYKSKNGEIDNKYVRVASQLRNAGVVYDGLFAMMDSCIKEDGSIDAEKISAIKTIRASGALSNDLPMLVDSCQRDENGKYSEKDLSLVCELTSGVIGGKEVCSLLPVVKNSEDAKDVIMLCSPEFSNKENLLKLVELMKKTNGELGENEMEVLYDLALNYFSDEDNYGTEEKFIKEATSIMRMSQAEDGTISDDAAGICAIMSKHAGEPLPSIKLGLQACFNEKSVVDPKLAQILWDMYIQKASLSETLDMINVCKLPYNKVDEDKADMIISLFEQKFPKEKIAKLVNPKQ